MPSVLKRAGGKLRTHGPCHYRRYGRGSAPSAQSSPSGTEGEGVVMALTWVQSSVTSVNDNISLFAAHV